MRRLLGFVVLLGVLAALAVLADRLRRRLSTPIRLGGPGPEEAAPQPTREEPPSADDLAEVWGIGPVYRGRLAEAGITTFAALAAAEPALVVAATGVPEQRAAHWIAQAAALGSR
ncbi:MAG: hypothetical protein JW785_06395 [Acidimicrobiia bacterium]|nr:hypothetical protein [Acidimicrobiia bacterium]